MGDQKNAKQCIIIRKDLNMRRGKEIAQGSHASISFLTRRLQGKKSNLNLSDAELSWIEGAFTKICLQVNSEQELLDVKAKAIEAGLEVHIITDAGKTEFGGVPTKTCLAIGPDWSDKIDGVTKHLKLY